MGRASQTTNRLGVPPNRKITDRIFSKQSGASKTMFSYPTF